MSTESPKFNHTEQTFAILFPNHRWQDLPRSNLTHLPGLLLELCHQIFFADEIEIASSRGEELILRFEIQKLLDQLSLKQILPETLTPIYNHNYHTVQKLIKTEETIGGCCQVSNPDNHEIFEIGVVRRGKPQAIIIHHLLQPHFRRERDTSKVRILSQQPIPVPIRI